MKPELKYYSPNPAPYKAEDLPRYVSAELKRLATIQKHWNIQSTNPKAALRLSDPISVTLDNTWIPLTVFDEITVNRGGVIAGSDQITVSLDAGYIIDIGLNVSLPQTEQIDVMMTINGVHAYSTPISLQGAGINDAPEVLIWTSNKNLVAGDVVAWEVRNGDLGSVDVDFVRSNFGVTRD